MDGNCTYRSLGIGDDSEGVTSGLGSFRILLQTHLPDPDSTRNHHPLCRIVQFLNSALGSFGIFVLGNGPSAPVILQFSSLRRCIRFPVPQKRQGSPVRNILLSNSDGSGATHPHENGWPPAAPDNSGMCPITLSNFQRSVNHCRRHLTMRTAGFRTAPRILFTRQRALWRLSRGPILPSRSYGTTRTAPARLRLLLTL
jgi:hypothetical protein